MSYSYIHELPFSQYLFIMLNSLGLGHSYWKDLHLPLFPNCVPKCPRVTQKIQRGSSGQCKLSRETQLPSDTKGSMSSNQFGFKIQLCHIYFDDVITLHKLSVMKSKDIKNQYERNRRQQCPILRVEKLCSAP